MVFNQWSSPNTCRWPRTLSMAQALCDLQLELQYQSSTVSLNAVDCVKLKVAADEPASLAPSTPTVKKSMRKHKPQIVAEVVGGQNDGNADNSNVDLSERVRFLEMANAMQLSVDSVTTLVLSNNHENIGNPMSHYPSLFEDSKAYCNNIMGDFPSAKEIARLDEKYLAKRCCLGYRAGRILKLAQAVDEGRIQLSKLEEFALDQLQQGRCNPQGNQWFGPFTRGNVMMCMGFYNVVPTDSETIRHLKQVHATATTIGTVKEVVEEICGHYEPYQFLAYWSELWSFYEGWFGKLSEMSLSDYRLITASNMKTKRKYISQRF
ncbi:hypothetical protein Cgig2_017617 [Carnegiea gigantea]|uniref:Uncharacterized protein n=1 Tax=Carnegiea gigantea TaxID=171969 RepID=A0A9Q1JXV6_9CARY|nr:hypothetical protein Cgig2_017617 [Carnegiea gigantea]